MALAPTSTDMTPDLRAAQQAAGLPLTPFDERLRSTGSQEQALYGALLKALSSGASPELATAYSTAGLTETQGRAALHRLAAVDLVALDEPGGLVGVFPLSLVPSKHVVLLADGRELQAMCAVDALGVPAMLGLPAVVASSDPSSGSKITVTVSEQGVRADPVDAVVLVARQGEGSLASACCRVIDFHVDERAAQIALDATGMTGAVLSVSDAHALGVALFGGLPGK